MVVAALILIVSTALFVFYVQVTCQKILSRNFDQDYFQSIVDANCLEFPAVQKAIEEFEMPVDYARLRLTLKCDYLALTYLLKNAANTTQRFSRQERMLMIYFRLVFLSLALRHRLRLGEKPSILKLTSVLEYFANVIGQRVNRIRFGNLAPSEYLLNL
jgi:hypothetical protein